MKSSTRLALALALALGIPVLLPAASAAEASQASAGLAATYSAIADTILAAKASEAAVVRAILAAHRDAALEAFRQAESSGDGSHLRDAGGHVGDFATEGGALVEPIRNRLLQGGHHHHSDDSGPEATYDEGYVVVSKKLKREALELAKQAARLGEDGRVDPGKVASLRASFEAIATRALATK